MQVVLTSPRICTQGLWRGLAVGVAQRPQPPPRHPGALGLVLFQFPLERGARRGGRCPGGLQGHEEGGVSGVSGVSAQQNTRSAYRRAGHQPAGPRRPGQAEGDANKEPEDEPSPSALCGDVSVCPAAAVPL